MKRGFTLIELLAVIVILAIITLIATPIVLNIINETKESADLRSVEFYMDAVEQAIMKAQLNGKQMGGTYNISEDGSLCLIDSECTDANKIIVEVKGDVPNSGSIDIENGTIKDIFIELNEKTIGKNGSGEIIYDLSSTLCKRVEGLAMEIGSKYQCKVKEDMEEGFEDGYYFYVLSIEDDSVNLIMDRNLIDPEQWDDSYTWNDDFVDNPDYSNVYGPRSAFGSLHYATEDWINVPNIIMDYEDENIDINTLKKGNQYGYGKIITENNVTKITMKDGTITNGDGYTNLKARLPRFDEVTAVGCSTTSGSCPSWLLDNLSSYSNGYWLLASDATDSANAFTVCSYTKSLNRYPFDSTFDVGSRPVISIKL